MQTISGLGICSLWCHHFARSWTQCIMEYHCWPYYWIYVVQGQYFRQANINFAISTGIKFGAQIRNSVRHDFIFFHMTIFWTKQWSGRVSHLLCHHSQEHFRATSETVHACMSTGLSESNWCTFTHLEFRLVWTTHKVHCLTLTQEDELIDWYNAWVCTVRVTRRHDR